MANYEIGISGLAVDLPPYRVSLRDWSKWTGADWAKIRAVVGTGFRLPGPGQGVYTMAANAVLKLIRQHDIDPGRVRYLALGTESSTDNSAGAIIIKGMVDSALRAEGLPAMSRHCEVPEFKHACLGGVYGMKNALRYLATDGQDSLAIVVSSDKALYRRGSSGEPTQGAGAVAMLLEAEPRIATVDLRQAGTASEYRGVDFRKPLVNRNGTGASPEFVDIPVFNGRYSTNCYMDEMQRALDDMFARRQLVASDYLRGLRAVFLHRPYRRMPETGWSVAYLNALATGSDADRAELDTYCRIAGVDIASLLREFEAPQDLNRLAVRERIGDDMFPLAMKVVRSFRQQAAFERVIADKLRLGAERMCELGNLYTGALPAWLAAGLTEAAERGEELSGQEILLIGYGSGDAADAIPICMVDGWQDAVAAIRFDESMKPFVDLTQAQYHAIREREDLGPLNYEPRAEFLIDRVGDQTAGTFEDAGIEYYRYVQ